MTEVAGRTAFITGGANGIGLGIARSFAQAGAKIALADIDEQALAAAKTELSLLTQVETVVLDVRDRDAYARAADDVETALGSVSLLFNNAGVAWGAPATKLTYEAWDWAIGINLHGVINGVQTFLPRMAKRGAGGHIVNTASGAGLVATGAGVLYHTAKFGVVGMSEALQMELAAINIGVSVLCPGPVATGIVRRSYEKRVDAFSEAEEKHIEATTEFLRQGVTIDEVGGMVLDAVQGNSLYILTDRLPGPYLEARTKALLEAMPVER